MMYIKELEAVRPNRPAGSENSVLREAAGRLDEGMGTGWSKSKIAFNTSLKYCGGWLHERRAWFETRLQRSSP